MSEAAPHTWTDERVTLLRDLVAGGFSAGVIAERLGGVSRSGVIGKVHRLGLSLGGNEPASLDPGAPSRTLRTPAASKPRPVPKPKPKVAAATPSAPSHPWRRALTPAAALPPPPPPPPPAEPTVEGWPKPAGTNAVDFGETKPNHCRMPLWGHYARGGLVCGEPVRTPGASWCAACHARVFTASRERVEAPKWAFKRGKVA